MEKNFGPYLKKKVGLIKFFLGPYFRGLKFLWEKILGLILKKLGLKLKKIGFIKFFLGPYYKIFWALFIGGPRQWPNWPSHWAGPVSHPYLLFVLKNNSLNKNIT
jgi:hypothetical protein